MNKARLIAIVDYFKTTHKATDNTTLGDLSHNVWCASMVEDLLKAYPEFDYDTTLGEVLEQVS